MTLKVHDDAVPSASQKLQFNPVEADMEQKLLTVEGALERTERQGEQVAALFRIAMSAVLLAAVWLSSSSDHGSHPIFMVAIAYGILSLVGLSLALTGIHHAALPYAFVFLDCIVVTVALNMLAGMQGMGMGATVALPLFSLSFVILIHSALRYQPWLVAFGACVFIALFLLMGAYQANRSGTMTMHMGQARDHTMMMSSPTTSQFLPLLLVGFAGALLFYIVRRTRNLAWIAARDGKRAAQLGRFFSPAVANQLSSEDFSRATYGGRRPVAVLFIDIRGFTRLSEQLSPDQLIEFLVSFRREVCRIVFAHGGTIDKFVGDAVLAVFGTPRGRDDDPQRAVDAVMAISEGIQAWVDRRNAAGEPAALVGIGAHYGEVFAGVIESGDILEHTVIGDTVNVAQRLERLTRSVSASLVISADLLSAAGADPDAWNLRREVGVELPGHDETVTVFHDASAGRDEDIT